MQSYQVTVVDFSKIFENCPQILDAISDWDMPWSFGDADMTLVHAKVFRDEFEDYINDYGFNTENNPEWDAVQQRLDEITNPNTQVYVNLEE